jgi:hypothetical protein
MGVSDPEIQKKVFAPGWQHEIERQSGHYGNNSSIVSNAVQFADPKFQAETFNECKTLDLASDHFRHINFKPPFRRSSAVPAEVGRCSHSSNLSSTKPLLKSHRGPVSAVCSKSVNSWKQYERTRFATVANIEYLRGCSCGSPVVGGKSI